MTLVPEHVAYTDQVAWSVSLSVTVVNPAKITEPYQDAVWVVDSGEPKEPCIRWGPDRPVHLFGKGHAG